MYNAGDFDTTETVIIPINTFTSDDPTASCTITDFAAGDVEIHKDGSTTQRSSDSGVSVSINFDGITGNHIISIDLSDDTDAGFYANGSRYLVRIEGVTVDAGTLNAWVGGFSIGCTLRPTTAGRKLTIESDGMAHADVKEVEGGDATDALQAGAQAALEANNLDHLAKTATAGADMTTEVVDNTILSRILANGDTSAFVPSTDGLQPIRDHIGDGTNLTEAGGDGDHLTEAGGDGDHLTEAGGTGDQLTAVPWNAAWDAEVESEVDDAIGGGTGTALTAIPWNAAWDAEVQSECADALTAYGAATSSDVTTVQNNATGEISADDIFEIPASGEAAEVKPIEFFFKDTQGNMEAPDAAPTISAVNEGDTSRDGNLSSTTMSLVSTGRYKVTYSVADSHAAESLRFTVSVTEGGATRLYQKTVLVQDEIGNKIDALYTAFLSTSAELAGAPAHNASIIDKIEFMFMNMKNQNVADNSGTPATISVSNNAGSAIATANVTQTADTSTKAQYS